MPNTMRKSLFTTILALCLSAPAAAQTKAVAESEAVQVKGDFAGSLVVTTDADWKTKWDASGGALPSFAKAGVVAYKKSVFVLTLFANPKLDAKGQANLRRDFKITNPLGKVQLSRPNLLCHTGRLVANNFGVYLSEPVIAFSGDPGDAPGIWLVEVKLRDVVRASELLMRSSFELKAAK